MKGITVIAIAFLASWTVSAANSEPVQSVLKEDLYACINGNTMPHACNCAAYYSCHNGDWYFEECFGGLHYSTKKQLCVPPNQGDCLLL